jgi:hypothetical protein
MRTITAYTIFVFIIYNLLTVIQTGIHAFSRGTAIPFVIMVPGTLSLLLSLLYIADTIHFRKLKLKKTITFIVSISLFTISLLLLLIGNAFTHHVNTVGLIPRYVVMFIWFPFLILAVDRLKKEE